VADAPQHFLRLEVVSPDGLVFEGDVAMVVVPAAYGELGILPRHAPLVASLSIGELRFKTLDGAWLEMAVAEGFVKVQFDRVIVLADAAELASEIDVARAKAAVERAQERLTMFKEGRVPEDEEIDSYRETVALARGRNRLKVSGRV
jgi:F-type H+-transporting ATPase subunit epsilon